MGEPKTCGSCRHWFRVEQATAQPVMLGQGEVGECRGGPPQVIPMRGGMATMYPPVGVDFPACALFKGLEVPA